MYLSLSLGSSHPVDVFASMCKVTWVIVSTIINSAANPVIYSLVSRGFRKGINNLFHHNLCQWTYRNCKSYAMYLSLFAGLVTSGERVCKHVQGDLLKTVLEIRCAGNT